MSFENNLKEELKKHVDSIDCPETAYYRVRNSYIDDVIKKGEHKFMKKKLIANIIVSAMIIIIPMGALAASHIIKAIRTETIQEENSNMTFSEYEPDISSLNSTQQTALNKICKAFPKLKEFKIASINTGEGNVGYEMMNWSSIQLEKDGEKFMFDIDNETGEFYHFGRYNWGINYNKMNEEEIVQVSKEMIGNLYADIDSYSYEFESPYTDLPDEKLQEMEKHSIELDKTVKHLKFTSKISDKTFTVDYQEDGLLAVGVTYK